MGSSSMPGLDSARWVTVRGLFGNVQIERHVAEFPGKGQIIKGQRVLGKREG
jgi:hypothetical protein